MGGKEKKEIEGKATGRVGNMRNRKTKAREVAASVY